MNVRRVCVDVLDAVWGVGMCRTVASFTRVYRVGVWFGFVRFALLLAVVLSWVARCFDSRVLLGLFCLLRVLNQTKLQHDTLCGTRYSTCAESMHMVVSQQYGKINIGKQ